MNSGGFIGGLSGLIEKLAELAEKGKELHEVADLRDPDGRKRGVVGFSIRVGLGDEAVKIERFGNLRRDEKTGNAVVQPVREPMVDVFDEADHVLVVAEMPGVAEEDVRVELKDDILNLSAERGDQKYHKEVLLPCAFPPESMSRTCRNGIVEIKFTKPASEGEAAAKGQGR
jgi:HSP20 family protein